jgi:hypothetical protein
MVVVDLAVAVFAERPLARLPTLLLTAHNGHHGHPQPLLGHGRPWGEVAQWNFFESFYCDSYSS